jgi:hypothetical protein
VEIYDRKEKPLYLSRLTRIMLILKFHGGDPRWPDSLDEVCICDDDSVTVAFNAEDSSEERLVLMLKHAPIDIYNLEEFKCYVHKRYSWNREMQKLCMELVWNGIIRICSAKEASKFKRYFDDNI